MLKPRSAAAMASLLQNGFRQLATRNGLRSCRCYTQAAYQVAQQKWQLGGIPRPRSILEDDDTPVDLSEDNDAANGARSGADPIHLRSPSLEPTPVEFKAHRDAMRKAFPEGWSPPRKLSREAMDMLRSLHRTDPDTFSTPILASKFRISPEAVRRILKSRWEPSAEKRTKLVVLERKQKEERRQKISAEREARKREQGMNVEELRRLVRKDDFWREKYARQDGDEEETETMGIGVADRFTLR